MFLRAAWNVFLDSGLIPPALPSPKETSYRLRLNALDPQYFSFNAVFKVSILKYTGSTRWIESTIKEIKELLDKDTVPPLDEDCDYCVYTVDVSNVVS